MNAFDETPHTDDFFVSDERSLLDHRWLVGNLLSQPWADCWNHERLAEAIQNSLCFGLYQRQQSEDHAPAAPVMVGFARAITDHATYSLICDVVVDERFRGRGLGKFLIATITRHPRVKRTVSVLRTTTATDFYKKFGYVPVPAMRRIPPP